ncbi:unnamed protein product [Dicrocoelium dendriticum]|nr:unnamed protein product [Dicrocoelium dendriticum]
MVGKLQKLSNGEPGESDFADSTESPAENGDAPAMHCKPISIPIQTNAEGSNAADRSGGIMIGYSAQFRIQPQLIGLAIGYRGATIQEARGLPGVRSVDLVHDGIVQVEAETVEACQAVRSLLDYTEAEIPVSPRLASRLIGSKGMNIRKLAASAGVRRAQLLDPLMRKRRQQHMNRQQLPISPDQNQFEATGELNQDAQCNIGDKYVLGPAVGDRDEEIAQTKDEKLPPPAFYLLGTRSAVAKMRLLLEFQADNWNELDELEETRRNLCIQLRLSSQPVRNNYASSGPPEAANRGGAVGRDTNVYIDERHAHFRKLPGVHCAGKVV